MVSRSSFATGRGPRSARSGRMNGTRCGGIRAAQPGSRYRRFLTPMEKLSESQLTYLTDVDHHDHEAMIAFDLATR